MESKVVKKSNVKKAVTKKSVVVAELNELQPVQQSPLVIMTEAKAAGLSSDEINNLMDLQDRYDDKIAKQAFFRAMAEFKRNPPEILKDKHNAQYDSAYVSIGNMVNTVSKAAGQYGLIATWTYPEPVNPVNIRVTCLLTHELGHSEAVTIEGPIDSGGKKNPLQQRKSARTYLKLETFEAVTGTASEEGNLDDDGNASGDYGDTVSQAVAQNFTQMINEDQINTIRAALNSVGRTEDKFLASFDLSSWDEVRAESFEQALARASTPIQGAINQQENIKQEDQNLTAAQQEFVNDMES